MNVFDELGLSTLVRSGFRRKPFGAVAMRLGYADADQVQQALKAQADQRAKGGLSEDAFRLATRLQASLEPDQRLLLVCGAAREPNLPELVSQLGIAIALMDGGPVLLLEADLKEASLHRRHGLPESPGLSDLILGMAELREAIRPTDIKGLSVIPPGSPASDSLSLLMAPRLSSLLQELKREFRLILIHSPPGLLYADAALLGSHCDGVILGITAGLRSRREVTDLHELFAGCNIPVTGTVLCAA